MKKIICPDTVETKTEQYDSIKSKSNQRMLHINKTCVIYDDSMPEIGKSPAKYQIRNAVII
jgi:hypothetical protein